jgi:hypothetical protein
VPREWLDLPAEPGQAATIAGGAARLTVASYQRWEAGDHVCIAAQVLRAERYDRWPLIHVRSRFAALAPSIEPVTEAAASD